MYIVGQNSTPLVVTGERVLGGLAGDRPDALGQCLRQFIFLSIKCIVALDKFIWHILTAITCN